MCRGKWNADTVVLCNSSSECIDRVQMWICPFFDSLLATFFTRSVKRVGRGGGEGVATAARDLPHLFA